jgi:hypothetical protein
MMQLEQAAMGEDNRREERYNVSLRGSARVAVGIEVLDVSSRGARARVSLPLPVGTLIKIGLPGEKTRHARVVWWNEGVTGFEFLAPLKPYELEELCAA